MDVNAETRERLRKKYWRVGGKYVSKKLTCAVIAAALLGPAIFKLGIVPIWESFFPQALIVNSRALSEFSGNGKVYDKQGRILYEGEIQNGTFEGNGALYNERGRLLYRGGFAGSDFNGEGVLYKAGGMIYQGLFADNSYQGQGMLYDGEGHLLYEGEFIKGLFSGDGVLYAQDGRPHYEGAFTEGKKNGSGVLYGDNGKPLYKGLFTEDDIDVVSLLGISYEDAGLAFPGRKAASYFRKEPIVSQEGQEIYIYGVADSSGGEFAAIGYEHMNMGLIFGIEGDKPAYAEAVCLWGSQKTENVMTGSADMTVLAKGRPDAEGYEEIPSWLASIKENPYFYRHKSYLRDKLYRRIYSGELDYVQISCWSLDYESKILFYTVEYLEERLPVK